MGVRDDLSSTIFRPRFRASDTHASRAPVATVILPPTVKRQLSPSRHPGMPRRSARGANRTSGRRGAPNRLKDNARGEGSERLGPAPKRAALRRDESSLACRVDWLSVVWFLLCRVMQARMYKSFQSPRCPVAHCPVAQKFRRKCNAANLKVPRATAAAARLAIAECTTHVGRGQEVLEGPGGLTLCISESLHWASAHALPITLSHSPAAGSMMLG
jgi:hypothetical protein